MYFAVLFLTALSALQRATSLSLSSPARDSTSPVAAAYYTSWHAAEGFPLSAISWDKYNTLIYSFALTSPSVYNLSLSSSDPAHLAKFVSQAHKNSVAAHIGIGGWSGSIWFSSNVATTENRAAFVKTVADFAKKYDLDGINFDWEFPNKQGIGCNIISADDTQNFLLFLQELRANPAAARLTLSASVSITPFQDVSGSPSTDVSGFSEVLDYISILNYDIWGSWSPAVGPNSPLNDTCALSANQKGSAVSAVKAWTAAGMPTNKIVLAVASYGHSFSVSPNDAFVTGSTAALRAYPKLTASRQPPGDIRDNTGSTDECKVYQGLGDTTFALWSLVNAGFLTARGDPTPGIHYRYDDCSQTPYVYNKTSEVMVSFDNARSFAAKGKYIKETGLRGFAMWEAGGDYNNILLNCIRLAAGFDKSD